MEIRGLDRFGGEEEEPPPKSSRGELIREQWRVRSSVLRCLIAAGGSWAITISPLVAASKSTLLGRLIGAIALAPAIAGPLLLDRNPRLARHLGLSTYVALAGASFWLAARSGVLASFDIFRASLGALAWGVFALSWSHPWSVADADLEKAPEGDTMGLLPRRRPPAYAAAIAAIGALAASSCLALGWLIEEPSRAVFGQALAAAAAIALLTGASLVAVIAGRDKSRESKTPKLPINRRVVNTMLLMLLVAIGTVAIYMTQR